MYSGDPPPSISPGGMNNFNQEQQNLQIQATGDVNGQPPSQGDMGHHHGNSSNQYQEMDTNRGLDDQTGLIVVDDTKTKAPSFTGLGHGEGNSCNQDLIKSRGLDGDGGPSVGDMVMGRVSETYDGVAINCDQEGKAPSLGDMGLRGTSETGATSGGGFDGPNAQEFVGISLVRKNFRKFYPNAYYKEDDEEN